MQRQSIRMYAEAIAFDVVKVYLSKGYYNGISPKFYIKDTLTTEQKLLHGDMGQEENGFNTYLLHASVILGRSYVISDAYGLTCYVDFSPIALTKEFDDLFYYDGDDLGAHYTPGVTTFKVWSPLSTEVTLKVFRNGTTLFFPMKREEKGVYSAKVFKDLDNWNYLYEIKMNEDSIESCDPYAYASTANMASSVVIDLNKVKPKKYPLKAVEHYTDAIIYEVGVDLHHKGKEETQNSRKPPEGIIAILLGVDPCQRHTYHHRNSCSRKGFGTSCKEPRLEGICLHLSTFNYFCLQK